MTCQHQPLMKTTNRNRAICQGDLERAGIGRHSPTTPEIQQAMSSWSSPYLEQFIKKARSEPWRQAAIRLLDARRGTNQTLRVLKAKRGSRRARLEKDRLRKLEQQFS